MEAPKSSRLSGFYKQSLDERRALIRAWLKLPEDADLSLEGGLSMDQADNMIENVVGVYNLPLGIGTRHARVFLLSFEITWSFACCHIRLLQLP